MERVSRFVTLLAFVGLLLWPLHAAHATATVSGNVKVLSGATNVSRTILTVELEGCTKGPRSSAWISTKAQEIPIDGGTGAFSYALLRNDTELSCDGAFTSNYLFTVITNGRIVWQKRFKIVDPVADLTTYPSYADMPTVQLPNYALRNGGNVFVGVQDFGGATIKGVDEDHSIEWENPETLDSGKFQKKIWRASTLQGAVCDIDGSGSITVHLELRSSPNVPGSAMTADMECTSVGSLPALILDPAIAAESYVAVVPTNVNGAPTLVRVHFNTK